MTDYSVARDRWGRPFVTTDGGPLQYEGRRKTPTNGTAYRRVSTLAGALDDKSGLIDWMAAQTAVGVVRDRSVHAQLAGLVSQHRDPWREAKTHMRKLVERAQLAASSDDGAGLGTAFHTIAELVDQGQEPEFVPEMFRPWLDRYREAMADWEVLDTEVFVVVDDLQVAGSLDKLVRHRETGTVAVADLKTGASDPRFPLKVETQVACYAHGVRYVQETGHRSPLHESVDLDHGLLIHVPVRGSKPRADMYPLDLARGWEAARLAARVTEIRKTKPLEAMA
ncbi:PD-(D/E)XK nuclease family protein [Tomitella gaofuii]|uniref:PD-(D/E)XK nuclease family protein n=1 Tax=Tomitella gaofuii TaxID=2760083 RepID=UPI0015FA6DC7|nr:PD-(D/E)XK nuclease family protein [Tomitella gaofuii]